MPEHVALLTGGSGDMGAAIGETLGELGYRVAIGYRSNAERANEVAGGIVGAFPLQIDVRSDESVQRAVADLRASVGTPVVVVNSAGITRDGPLLRMDADDWEQVIDTDLSGTFRVCRAVVKGMVARRFGRIVNIGSVSGTLGPAGQTSYAAAKAGLLGFSKSLSREVGRRNVTANVVAPGIVPGEMAAHLNAGTRDAYIAMSSIRRPVDPAEVALAVRFCVECGALSGQLITVDGGIT